MPPEPLHQIEALGPRGPYRAHNRLTVTDVAETPVAELSLVPRLFVHRSLAALRQARSLETDKRIAALAQAGGLFAEATLSGHSPEEYQYTVSRVSGLPISMVRAATVKIATAAQQAYATAQCALPGAAVNHWSDPATRGGRAVWTRRGDVFAVHASGNQPGVHALWLEALALGYRVAVRPSQREPFTAHRLITALREAGFGDDHVVLLPTEHAVADAVIEGANRAIVYGGDEVVRKYATSSSVLPQGPGRSKILITGRDWRPHLDTVVASVTELAGTSCVNTTAVFAEHDPSGLAEALAQRLAALPSLPPEDEKAVLPVKTPAVARSVERSLLSRVGGAKAWLGGEGIVHELGDGGAVLRPAVFEVDDAAAGQTGIEMGFPCVWVAPWSGRDGVAPLRDTLVLTAVTEDERLVESLVSEPTIHNVYLGDHPTHWFRQGVPHDGYLAEFLMRTKTVIRD